MNQLKSACLYGQALLFFFGLFFLQFFLFILTFVKNDLDFSLGSIRNDFLHLVFCLDHLRSTRQVTGKMDGVKFTFRRAQPASDTAVQVDDCSAAAQTAERVYITPHISGGFPEGNNYETVMNVAINNVSLVLQGKDPVHIVDRKLGY